MDIDYTRYTKKSTLMLCFLTLAGIFAHKLLENQMVIKNEILKARDLLSKMSALAEDIILIQNNSTMFDLSEIITIFDTDLSNIMSELNKIHRNFVTIVVHHQLMDIAKKLDI